MIFESLEGPASRFTLVLIVAVSVYSWANKPGIKATAKKNKKKRFILSPSQDAFFYMGTAEISSDFGVSLAAHNRIKPGTGLAHLTFGSVIKPVAWNIV